jgi:hypothetical protein
MGVFASSEFYYYTQGMKAKKIFQVLSAGSKLRIQDTVIIHRRRLFVVPGSRQEDSRNLFSRKHHKQSRIFFLFVRLMISYTSVASLFQVTTESHLNSSQL